MKTTLMLAVALALIATGAIAKPITNPPTQAQLDAFYAQCVKNAPEAAVLCQCKQQIAPKLVDTAFMDVIIAAMKPGSVLDPKYNVAYNDYIARSNKVCKPTYM